MVAYVLLGRAQEPQDKPPTAPTAPAPAAAAAASTDPRVGLKAGLKNAGQVARHMQLVTTLPKPEGFFDPKQPAGEPTGPERGRGGQGAQEPPDAPETPDAQRGAPPQRSGLNFANSDLAFRGEHLFIGNFNGFNTYDIEDPKKARLIASVVCPGGQGDVSVFTATCCSCRSSRRAAASTAAPRARRTRSAPSASAASGSSTSPTCASRSRSPPSRPAAARIRIRWSRIRTTTRTCTSTDRGPAPCDRATSWPAARASDPKEDPNTALFSIDVIQVPLNAPDTAKIVSRPRIFADPATGAIAGLWPGGDHGPGSQRSRLTNQCHDITVFPEVGLAAGACSGNGILLDISDPVKPVRLDAVTDKNFAYWHSATFNNDGTKIVFTDEWGGGTRPRCRATDLPTWGANAVFDIVDRKLRFGGYYKLPAPQTDQENCVAHNGSIIPVPGRDIMVQAWYQGGVSVFDFTDSSKPVEIAYFDRGPLDAKELITGGYWSTYWFNGYIYGAEIARGLDVFRLTPSEHLSQNEIDAATEVRQSEFNAQHQPKIVWQPTSAVARAYVDQLARTKSIDPERAKALTAAMQRAERMRSARDNGAAAVVEQLGTLATQLEADAGKATGRAAARLRALSETLKGRAAALR